jgi:type 1 glutamine amidotransferase
MTPRPAATRRCLAFVLPLLLLALAMRPLAGAELVPVTEEQMARIRAALPTAAAKPHEPRRILIFWRTEGYVHACIPVANFALTELGHTTGAYAAELSTDMTAFTPDNLARFDAVLFNNATRLAFADPAHREALMEFVEENGGGLIGIHAATDSFYDFPDACAAIGGHFDQHPWLWDGTWAIKLDEPEHPANAAFGGRGFWINDELYQIGGPYSRDTHRVLLSLDMSKPQNHQVDGIKRTDGDFPVSWLKHAGTGRVFYCSLGHNEHIYWNPAVLRHYLAGIQYVLGDRDLRDAPSNALTHPPEPALAPDEPPHP